VFLTDYLGRLQPLAGVGRRHPDIDHHQIRRGVADQPEELRAVTGLADDLETGALEQTSQALAEQDVIFRHDHAQPGHE
jgi:hypothetical protein